MGAGKDWGEEAFEWEDPFFHSPSDIARSSGEEAVT